MAFFGRSFIFDGTPSETFGLYVGGIDADGINSSMGNSSMEIVEKKIFRRANPYFFSSSPAPKLSFDFEGYFEGEMDADHFAAVQKWLFSTRNYKKLAIDQIDIQDVYFNCILNNPEIKRVGNLITGFSCGVECDGPFAYKYPKTTTYTYTTSSVDSTVTFYNESQDSGGYLYPSLVVTQNNIAGGFSITNASDSNRVVSFTGLQGNEILTIDSNFQTISSSTGLRRLANSNYKFLRLVPGVNSLRFVGNIQSIAMTCSFVVKKLGG